MVNSTIVQIYSQQDIELLIKTILKLIKNCKTLHDLSPNFMKEIFYRFSNIIHSKDNLDVYTQNTIKFGNKGLVHLDHTYEIYYLNKLSKN